MIFIQSKKLNMDIQLPRNPKYDTLIIKPRHFTIFSNWIKEKGTDSHNHYHNLRDNPYYFNLIYRASRDGYSNGTCSIGCYLTHGPIFGGDFFCHNDGTIWYFNNCFNSYPDIDIPIGSIIVDDYEVFQVVSKRNLNN
ncbi:unnamed protein product [Rhizophagus irregularis]|nr:unnamed protein product [Rhizophagus irregularis]